MTTITETIPEFLSRTAKKSHAEGGDGLLTAKQVGEHFGISTVQALRKLEILCDRNLVTYILRGTLYYWKVVDG